MINQYKSPKDKISTIINFCNILSAMILNTSKNKNNSTNNTEKNNNNLSAAGADEVLPIVVYALLQGNIKKLKSNINYIRLFRHHSRFDSNKEEYFTTVLESGVEFIDKLNVNTDLKIEKEEFSKLIRESENKMKLKIENLNPPQKMKNIDENFLIYFLSEGEGDNSNNTTKKSINDNEKKDESIELNEFKANAVNINTSSIINKSLLNENNGIINLNLDKLYKEYFNKDLKEMSLYQLEKMVNDFKITIMLVDSYLNKGKLTEINNENI